MLVVALLTLGAAAPRAVAGPNANGTLLLHAQEGITWCQDTASYCGQSGLPDCSQIDARVNGSQRTIIFALAAFPPDGLPRMKAVTFGLDYEDGRVLLVGSGSCADFELTDSGWPGPGTGTSLTWDAARVGLMNEVYWFAGYSYYAPVPSAFALTPNPTQGGYFGDDSVPALLDPIAAFGVLGFDQPGFVACPTVPTVAGACCAADGSCVVRTPESCAESGGVYQGDGTDCVPNPCTPVPGACCLLDGSCIHTTEAECAQQDGIWNGWATLCAEAECPARGACCSVEGQCVVVTETDCLAQGDAYQGDGSNCDPSPCGPLSGACCLPSQECVPLSRADCEAQDGVWSYHGVPCEEFDCPSLGACCTWEGSCRVAYESVCQGAGEIYQGDGTSCDPNPCPRNCNLAPVVRWENRPSAKPQFAPHRLRGTPGGEGVNRGGVLILHAESALAYTDDGSDYCGQATLASCDDAVTRHDGLASTVIFALAAFAENSTPRVAGVSFGLSYGNCVVLEDWGACADFEVPTAGWPETGEGTALAWSSARTTLITEVYWFAAYTYEGRLDGMSLIEHPTQGAVFADDRVPAVIDPVQRLGSFGFGQDGVAPCPSDLSIDGACCRLDGTCMLASSQECINQQGTYAGDWTICPVEPCLPRGACCVAEICSIQTEEECLVNGGAFQGIGTDCLPSPCVTTIGCQPGAVSGTRGGEPRSVGPGEGVLIPESRGTGCGTLSMNADGQYENGIGWSYGGVRPPYFGAFAECYQGGDEVCSLVLDLTQTGSHFDDSIDAYLWDSDGTCPGNVIAVQFGYVPSSIAYWPSVSRHTVNFNQFVPGEFWAGYWGNWPGQYVPFYVAVDLDGFGGCPVTNIAPGLGYATGWQNASVVWGPMKALGIGVEMNQMPVPIQAASWGRVKALYGK
ncbi:MAG: hypothetical protein IPK72_18410 [Candidatus Eisenbacteria bacterium]|nr:hypothetical protein [Candidatus Eisenbacteria bacterium]